MQRVDVESVFVLGAGNFGTCLAQHLASLGHQVIIWARSPDMSEAINKKRHNPKYLKNILLHENISSVHQLSKEVFYKCDAIVLAIPTQYLRGVLMTVANFIDDQLLICAAKGIELESLCLTSDILESIFGTKCDRRVSTPP